jgi:poly(hydroxyalkanoate) depolymerase family esterase
LVIALHGCTQTEDEYDHGTGWSSLADSLGFAVVYPQQQPANNAKNCFSWFLPGDITRGHGEALSIREMVEHAIAKFAADRRKVFVTGLSAGGAMASVMLATYPELFAGGAIIAGLPYGCASNVQQAFEAMFAEQGHAAQALGDRVRAASRHREPWPKISVWHGTSDPIVKPSNGEDIIRQWTNVHGLPDSPSYQELIGSYTRRVWSDANGKALIEAFTIGGWRTACRLQRRRAERALPGHFSWMWEFPLRITSPGSGACANLSLKYRAPLRKCQHRFRFQLVAAPLSSLKQPPNGRSVRPKPRVLGMNSDRRLTRSTPTL